MEGRDHRHPGHGARGQREHQAPCSRGRGGGRPGTGGSGARARTRESLARRLDPRRGEAERGPPPHRERPRAPGGPGSPPTGSNGALGGRRQGEQRALRAVQPLGGAQVHDGRHARPGTEARQSRTYASTIASMEKAATRARAAWPSALRRAGSDAPAPRSASPRASTSSSGTSTAVVPSGWSSAHRGEPVGHGGQPGRHGLEHRQRAPLPPGGLGIDVQPGQELRGAVHHLAEEMGPRAQRCGGRTQRTRRAGPCRRAPGGPRGRRAAGAPSPPPGGQAPSPGASGRGSPRPPRRPGGRSGRAPVHAARGRRAGEGHPVPDGDHRGAGGAQPRSSVRTSAPQATQRAADARAERGPPRASRPAGGASWWKVASTRVRGASARAATALSQGPRSWAWATAAPDSAPPSRRMASGLRPRTAPSGMTGSPAASAQARTGPSSPKATRRAPRPNARDRAARSTTSRSSPPTSRPWMTCATFTGCAPEGGDGVPARQARCGVQRGPRSGTAVGIADNCPDERWARARRKTHIGAKPFRHTVRTKDPHGLQRIPRLFGRLPWCGSWTTTGGCATALCGSCARRRWTWS